MSFHAAGVQLPSSAVLKVTINGSDYFYRATDLHNGELWSRIGRGDTLTFELSIAASDRAGLNLNIASVQAGYRSFDSPQRDHPHYKALNLPRESATASTTCTENWECHTNSVNNGPGQATVALIIGNVGQCSGVLMNDVPGDGTPYVLTARHCENGDPDGGQSGAAASVTAYWDAITPCSQTLGSIYAPGIPAQYGATTVVEQQDTWLLRLDQLPVVDDAYYAGWDATGATFIGGFTAHHGLGGTRQYTEWFGQANFQTVPGSTLGVGFTSSIWGTVNAVGSVAPGASGSGLFDSNGHLVGTLSRAMLQGSTENSPGVCPASSPPAPSPQNITAESTALSGVFASTSDPKSTTGAVTIQSVLDPAHTGTQVLDGQKQPPFLSLTTNAGSDPQTGASLYIYWSSKRASTCTASGGTSGDGWAGPRSTSGQATVTNFDGGNVEYVLSCGDGTRSVTQRVTVHWQLATPSAQLETSSGLPGYGTPFDLSWGSNVRPCTASGGNAGDGWTGTFTTVTTASVVETNPGSVTYKITCGSGSRTASSQVTVAIFPPSASIDTDVTTPIRIGETVHLFTNTSGRPCTASGGYSGDGWAGTSIPDGASPAGGFTVTESIPGSYTYVVSCGSGAHIATSQVTITFTSDAPNVTLTAAPSPARAATLDFASGDEVLLSWNANVRPCALSVVSPLIVSVPPIDGTPHGGTYVSSVLTGDITYQVTCGSGATRTQASTVVTYTGAPAASVTSPVNVIAGSQFTVVASENAILPCTATGGSGGNAWAGSLTMAQQLPYLPMPEASVSIVETTPGSYTYTVTCGTGSQQITAHSTTTVLATPPSVTMTVSKPQPLVNEPITISWNSNASPCTSAGGTGTDGWGGALPSTGTVTLTEHTAGTFFFQMRCGVAPLFSDASASVTFVSTAAPQLAASSNNLTAGEAVKLTWASSDGSPCSADGGTSGDGWAGQLTASGSMNVREAAAATYTYSLTCGTAPRVSTQVAFVAPPSAPQPTLPPSVTITASATSVTEGNAVTLTYSPTNADVCTAAGGSTADGWQNSSLISSGGTQSVTETTPGTYTYSIICKRADFPDATSSVSVTVNAQVLVSGSPSTGGKGGGGGLGLLEALSLAGLAIVRLLVKLVEREGIEPSTPAL